MVDDGLNKSKEPTAEASFKFPKLSHITSKAVPCAWSDAALYSIAASVAFSKL